MQGFNKNIDITRNVKIIEWLKSQLLTDIAELFRTLINGVKNDILDDIAEIISNLIIVCYLLARRLGISYNTIDIKIQNKLKLGIIEENELEKKYNDLSKLSRHLSSTRK